ncbi:hypothetical protein HY065_02155, partial [Candidatus Berkelbacteria bacterium]|nr:hypothetical protein [Candidatus Berkelbacteria bacterium]
MNKKIVLGILAAAAAVALISFAVRRLMAYQAVNRVQQSAHQVNRFPNCTENKTLKLSALPIKLENIHHIVPMGRMADAHVTPTDHGYIIFGDQQSAPDAYEIYAPGDARITKLEHFTETILEKRPNLPTTDDYRIEFQHPCNITSYYIHIDKPVQKILDAIGGQRNAAPQNLTVKAGELIGHAGGTGFDFAVVDYNTTLPGFLTPALYEREPWKVHTVDFFDAFAEPVRSQLLTKGIRATAPFAGKIDYDVEDKLVGNWFKKGTGGYAGTTAGQGSKPPERYWDGHVSFAYHHIDPAAVEISIGNYDGRAGQFALLNNAPDPKTITVESGPIKLELVKFSYRNPDGRQLDSEQDIVKGVTVVPASN